MFFIWRLLCADLKLRLLICHESFKQETFSVTCEARALGEFALAAEMGLCEYFHLEAILRRLINEDAARAVGVIALGLEDGRAALKQLSLA